MSTTTPALQVLRWSLAFVFVHACTPTTESAAQAATAAPKFGLELSVTGFADSLVSGQGTTSTEPGGKVDLAGRLNGEAVGLWPGFFVGAHLEQSFGDDVNTQGDGTILPVNTALAFPREGGSDTNFSLTVTQVFGSRASVTAGKFNLLEALAATPLIGGGGTETFQNIGLAAPVSGVTPPYVVGGLLGLETAAARLSIFVYDPRNAQEDDVLGELFSEGATFSASAAVPVAPGGLGGRHTLRLVYSSASGLDFDSLPALALPPDSDDVLGTRRGYHFASYSLHQYLVQQAPNLGWGVFGQLAFSEGNPNPVRSSALLGLGGEATFIDRDSDRWGFAGFYYDFSDDLENGLTAIGSGLRDEYGMEAFYEVAINATFRLGGDVQLIRPGTPGTDPALFANIRVRLVFGCP